MPGTRVSPERYYSSYNPCGNPLCFMSADTVVTG